MQGLFVDWYSAQSYCDEINSLLPYHQRAVVITCKRGHSRRYSIVIRNS